MPTPQPSKTQAVNGIALVLATARLLLPVVLAALAYAAWTVHWGALARSFFLGPGRWSRIFMLVFSLVNWKNMPFMWTIRVWNAIITHSFLRSAPPPSPPMLFAPLISPSRAPLLEIDYNLHKSNSTYFSDLDVSRSHLVSYLLKHAMARLANNSHTRLVLDPTTNAPASGSLGIMLGAAHCSWHREIPPAAPYELWTRVLSWDRKWLYIVTHFVPAGLGRPADFLDHGFRKKNAPKKPKLADNWQKKIYATAVSKYVFKLDRLTIHPAVLLEASGLLPQRDAGWKHEDLVDTSPDHIISQEPEKLKDGELAWQWVEWRRQKGMEYAAGFLKMDDLASFFNGGQDAAIGVFGPC
ncbi:hypothetical protein TD95_003259 [Thielaviopsis punctulata]|uniref:Capsule polysaccharide biosynthesis protein n=1 Tax=Thielaviopsis punctulata TaxID=72032 RepID=A0A0F4Z8L1_9PEZI|nr:hypothetical protein TD95_003259 [Thielaviopsis punctulata]